MPGFGIKRHGEPIYQIQIKNKFSTGIEVDGLPGVVPEFYEIRACNAANYRYYHDWQELDQEQKSVLIGHYYGTVLIDAHKDDAVSQKMKHDQKKQGTK